ncbi:MAG: type 1 glutamine amidotransferase domain-containing protein [Vicinamibacteria bacterium]
MKILMVLTSHNALGDSGEKTGFWLDEFAAPYYAFMDAAALVTLASPLGGEPPVDPRSRADAFQTEATRRLGADPKALAQLASTVRLADVAAEDFDAVFYPGGHGPLWDLSEDMFSIALIEATLGAGKPAAFVCHAPGVLRHVQARDGASMIVGRDVTGFADTEEAAAGLTDVVPFSVEDMLRNNGGRYTKAAADGAPHVVVDGMLITGQNPASSEGTAKALLRRLNFFSAPSFVATIPWNAA